MINLERTKDLIEKCFLCVPPQLHGFFCEIGYRFTYKNTNVKMIMYGLTCGLIL